MYIKHIYHFFLKKTKKKKKNNNYNVIISHIKAKIKIIIDFIVLL